MRSAGGHWLVGVQVSGHDESINNRQFQMGKNHTTITAVCEVQIYFIQSGEFQAGLLGRDQMVFINVKFGWFMCRLWTDLSWFNLMEAIKVM